MQSGFSANGRGRIPQGSSNIQVTDRQNTHTKIVAPANQSTFYFGKAVSPKANTPSFAQQLYASAVSKPSQVSLVPAAITPPATERRTTSSRSSTPTHSNSRPTVSSQVPPVPPVPSFIPPPQLSSAAYSYFTESDNGPPPAEFYRSNTIVGSQSRQSTGGRNQQISAQISAPSYSPSAPSPPSPALTYVSGASQRNQQLQGLHPGQQIPPQPVAQVTTASRPRSNTPPPSNPQAAYPSPTPSSVTSSLPYAESPPYTPLPAQPLHRSLPSPQLSPSTSSQSSPPIAQSNHTSPQTFHPSSTPSSPPYVIVQAQESINRSPPITSTTHASSANTSGTTRSRGLGSDLLLGTAGGIAGLASAAVFNEVLDNNSYNDAGNILGLADSLQNFTIGNGGDFGIGDTGGGGNDRPPFEGNNSDSFGTSGGDGASWYDQLGLGTGHGEDPYAYNPPSPAYHAGEYQQDPDVSGQGALPEYSDAGYLTYTGEEDDGQQNYQIPNQDPSDSNSDGNSWQSQQVSDQHQSDQQQQHQQHQQQPQHQQHHQQPQHQHQHQQHQQHQQHHYQQQHPSGQTQQTQYVHHHHHQPPIPHPTQATHANTSIAQQNINQPHVPQTPSTSLYSQSLVSNSPHLHVQQPNNTLTLSGQFHTSSAPSNPLFQASRISGPTGYVQHHHHAAVIAPVNKPNRPHTVARPPASQHTQAGLGTNSRPPYQPQQHFLQPPAVIPAQQPQHNYGQQIHMPRPQVPNVGGAFGTMAQPHPLHMPQSPGTGPIAGFSPPGGANTNQPHAIPVHPPQHASNYPLVGPSTNGTLIVPAQYHAGVTAQQGPSSITPTPASPPSLAQPQSLAGEHGKDPDTGINAQKIVQYAKTAASVAGVAVKIFQAAETLTGNNNTGSNNVFF